MNIPPIIDFKTSEYKQFIDDITKDTFIFLGAGFTKQVGYKIWEELVQQAINEFWYLKLKGDLKDDQKLTWSIKNELSAHVNKMYVMDYLRSLDENKYYEVIENIFEEDSKKIKTDIIDIIKPLVRDPKYKFLQTNIDNSFEKTCSISESVIRINPNFSEDVKLNYLHGRIDKRPSWILTQEDYLLNYQSDDSSLMRFLIGIFKKYTVLFIGYSLSDYEILQIISKSRINSTQPENLRRHYIFMPTYESIENELLINEDIYRKNFGINMIKFNIEQRGYDLLNDNLKNLVDVIIEKRKNEDIPSDVVKERFKG